MNGDSKFPLESGSEAPPDSATSTREPASARRDAFFAMPPTLSLPKGGGAIRGIGEKFTANPVTGTGHGIGPYRDIARPGRVRTSAGADLRFRRR